MVWVLPLILTMLFLAACAAPSPTGNQATIQVMVASTLTQAPTPTSQPTATVAPTATPLPPAISAQNAAGLEKLGEISAPSLRKVVFSPDGKVFASGAGNEADFGIKIWQSRDGVLIKSITAFSGIVWDLAFSPDGKWIASAADDQNGQRVRIWNAADGSLFASLDGPPTTSSVAFSPDGSRLAVGGLNGWPQGIIWIYDTTTWQTVQVLGATGQNVTALVYSRDGSQLISGGTDGHIRLWSLSDGLILNLSSPGQQANRLALSPDGALLASSFCTKTDSSGCIKGGIAIWRTTDWTIIQKFEDIAESLVFSVDGSLLVSGSGANDPFVRIRRVDDWLLVHTLAGEAFSVALSPDDRLLVSANWNTISLWGLPPN
jgi:WD40 repeat protein